MAVGVNPIDALPNKQSKSEDWTTFWTVSNDRYGTEAATVAFMKAWAKRRGDNADAATVSHNTGLQLDESALEHIQSVGQSTVDLIGGTINTATTGVKVVFYGAIGLAVVLVGGLVIRIITMSDDEAGQLAGAAAKAAVVA